jgi:hypothetical protein
MQNKDGIKNEREYENIVEWPFQRPFRRELFSLQLSRMYEVWRASTGEFHWPDNASSAPSFLIECEHRTSGGHSIFITLFRLKLGSKPMKEKEKIGSFEHILSKSLYKHVYPQFHGYFSQTGRYGIVFCSNPTTLYCFPVFHDPLPNFDLKPHVIEQSIPGMLVSSLDPVCASDDLIIFRSTKKCRAYALTLPSLEVVSVFGGYGQAYKLDWPTEYAHLLQLTNSRYLKESFGLAVRSSSRYQDTRISENLMVYHVSYREEKIDIEMLNIDTGVCWTHLRVYDQRGWNVWKTWPGMVYRDQDNQMFYMMPLQGEGSVVPLVWSVPINSNATPKDPVRSIQSSDYELDYFGSLKKRFMPTTSVSFNLADIIHRTDLHAKGAIVDFIVTGSISARDKRAAQQTILVVMRYHGDTKKFTYNRFVFFEIGKQYFSPPGFRYMSFHRQYPDEYVSSQAWPLLKAKEPLRNSPSDQMRRAIRMFLRLRNAVTGSWLLKLPRAVLFYNILPRLEDEDLLALARADPYLLISMVGSYQRLNHMILDRFIFSLLMLEVHGDESTDDMWKRRNGWLLLAIRAGHGAILELLEQELKSAQMDEEEKQKKRQSA